MKIQGIKLLTSKLEKQKTFYTEMLGFPLISETTENFTITIGDSCLTFEKTIIEDEDPFYHFAIDIPGNKVDESIAWLYAKGITLNLLPYDEYRVYSKTWNSTSVYFYDYGGNIVEFIARHNLDYSSNTDFSMESLLNISEIGLVVENVSLTKELLETHFSICGYKDSYESFAAVGDEKGLFILSASERVWLGSNKQANIYKTEVTIKDVNKGKLAINNYPYTISSI